MSDPDDREHLGRQALSRAEELLGVELVPTEDVLAGSRRALVFRAITADRRPPGSVIVKAYAEAAGEGFVREAASLGLLAGRRAPSLLAASAEPPMLVMQDLGRGRSLADALLGDDPALAEQLLTGWAEALADVHAATWQRPEEFRTALDRYAGDLGIDLDSTVEMITDAAGRLARSGLWPADTAPDDTQPDARLDDELVAAAVTALRTLPDRLAGRSHALSPTDTCPDNNLQAETGDQDRGEFTLLDFEGGSYRHVAWDLAYLRVPWATCWCAWSLPDAVSRRAEDAWAARLARNGVVVDRDQLTADVELAGLVWDVTMVVHLLPLAWEGEQVHPDPRPGPQRRAMAQNHLRRAADSSITGGEALAELAGVALSETVRRWGHVPLQAAPAFR